MDWFDFSDPNTLENIIFRVACEHPHVSDTVCYEMARDAAKAIRAQYEVKCK